MPTTTAAAVGAWPDPADVLAAIQNPDAAFTDKGLQRCKAQTDAMGMPRPRCGSFATVYRLECGSQAWAVRVFQNRVTDQERRYAAISRCLGAATPPAMVKFDYQTNGLRVNGTEYPLIKMEWIDGQMMSEYVSDNLTDPAKLIDLAARWWGLVSGLEGNGVAHCDLQHGNVLVMPNGDLKLVDYDGMYVSDLATEQSPEFGHPNFQHPRRKPDDYCDKVDLFSAVVIYTSLRALATDPKLWDTFNNDNNLFMTAADFGDPSASEAFRRLDNNSDQGVRILGGFLREWCEAGHPLQAFRFKDVAAASNAPYPPLPVLSADWIPAAKPVFKEDFRGPSAGLVKWLKLGAAVVVFAVAVVVLWPYLPVGPSMPALGDMVKVTLNDRQVVEGRVIRGPEGVLHVEDANGNAFMLRNDQIASWEKAVASAGNGPGATGAASGGSPFAEHRPDTRVIVQPTSGAPILGTVIANANGAISIRTSAGVVREFRYEEIVRIHRP